MVVVVAIGTVAATVMTAHFFTFKSLKVWFSPGFAKK